MALGLMAFALGTLVVGMALVGVLAAAALGGVVPIVAGFCGIALFTSAWWSLLLGESLLAATFGTVSGFFCSLAMLPVDDHGTLARKLAPAPAKRPTRLETAPSVLIRGAW